MSQPPSLPPHPGLLGMIRQCRDEGTTLHLLGLVSDGGVHSHMNHLLALLHLAKKEKLERVMVQAITDGRDTPPQMGLEFIRQLQQQIREIGAGRIAAICGRFYAMDRDNRWERVERAFRALTEGQGIFAPDPVQALEEAYRNGETDEFIAPRLITGETGLPVEPFKTGMPFFSLISGRTGPERSPEPLSKRILPPFRLPDVRVSRFL